MRIPLYHVDAFAERAFQGNPAAVCFLDRWLDDGLLRKVAAENNLPATAFLVTSAEGYELRWFSAVCELKLCGHATLAAAFILFNFVSPKVDQVVFSTRFRGKLLVKRQGKLLTMDFPALTAKSCATSPELLRTLGTSLSANDVLEVLSGNETNVVVLRSENHVRSFQPDFVRLQTLHPYVFAITAQGDSADFVSRYFAPGYGIPEDFVTGSLHCLLTPIWGERLGKSTLQARQLSSREGEMKCELRGDRVFLHGTALAILKGSLTI